MVYRGRLKLIKNYWVLLKIFLYEKINWPDFWMAIRMVCFVFLYCMNISPVSAKTEGDFPDDVSVFFHDADICQYLAGEWDSNLPPKRKNELSDEMNKVCSNIHERQEYFEKKYVRNKSIIRKLKSYEF
jgi:hypothetical protein